jgi:hypothetical protein
LQQLEKHVLGGVRLSTGVLNKKCGKKREKSKSAADYNISSLGPLPCFWYNLFWMPLILGEAERAEQSH